MKQSSGSAASLSRTSEPRRGTGVVSALDSRLALQRWLGTDGLVDAVGLGLVLAGVLWAAIVARNVGGTVVPVGRFAAAAVLTYALARAASARTRALVPLMVVLALGLLQLHPMGGTYPSGEKFGPLQYANASAALYLLGAAASAMLAAHVRTLWVRLPSLLVAAVFAAATLASGSQAAGALLFLIPLAAAARRPATVRATLAVGAALAVAGLVATVWLGAAHRPGPPGAPEPGTVETRAATALSRQRLTFWHEALGLARTHPVMGVGPGQFREVSPTAHGDPDAVAAHNDYLQAAAELGVPGLVVVAGLMAWAYLRLWWSRADTAAGVVGAALTAMAVQASVDYVLHAPAVLLSLIALLAAGSAVPETPGPTPATSGSGEANLGRGELVGSRSP